jgi:hypothetical protein
MLMRVSTRHFVAGLVFDHFGRCIRAAPILAWAKGERQDALERDFKRKGWKVECLPPRKSLTSREPSVALAKEGAARAAPAWR